MSTKHSLPKKPNDDSCCSPPWIRRLLPPSKASVWLTSADNVDRVSSFDDDADDDAIILIKERGVFSAATTPTQKTTTSRFWDQKRDSPTTVSTQEESSDDTDDSSEDNSQDSNIMDHDFMHSVVPESLEDLLHSPRILTDAMMQQLHSCLPESLKMNPWHRCFAIGRDGDSFIKLLDSCSAFTNTILVIRTVEGHVLGGFASQPWQAAPDRITKPGAYYGTGQSFLFASCPEEIIPGLNTESRIERSPSETPLQIFSWTGSNDYCQICDTNRQMICMGGGGDFGWILCDHLTRGQTGHCRTFGNPPLVSGGSFEVADVEVYGLQSMLAASFLCDSRKM
ncbi:hypothetical protein FisN_18Lh214 [Fistulifera solaris]|uniref:Oxidation resistance protein 1 n=1 Tax=Fistulifera solaris TaxID=1519565 RepID=A0A1Z5JU43_FISSO|nr:hypothetical protein FisN_18Lh214 [Fistulifera solaris]|eukprot:GAX17564.1 hypothetical protein FisN_18Lh214 [Fistulifera solaris]